jgi:tetratricopeptide (TPR) repeat protein
VKAIVVAIALAAAAAPSARPAFADSPTDADDDDDKALTKAKKLYREGEKLFALGKFSPALTKYEAAFEAKPLPAFLFNIGQCHRNLGDFDAAIFSFRKYLKLKPDADNKQAVLDYIDELEREKQKASANDVGLIEPEPDRGTGEPVDRPHRGTPVYKKWWFWGGIAVVGAGVVGTAVVLSGGGPPSTDLGNIDFGK